MLECANTENCRQAKIIAVGEKTVFDKTAIIVHMLEDPGIHIYIYIYIYIMAHAYAWLKNNVPKSQLNGNKD